MSLKQPSAAVLQSFALFSASTQICLKLAHVAGERYGEADILSRGRKLGGLDIATRQPDWYKLLFTSRQVDIV